VTGPDIDRLVETVRGRVEHAEGAHPFGAPEHGAACPGCIANAALSDLAARARERDYSLVDSSVAADRDRLARRVAELEQESAAWRDWIDKPHKDDRWQAVLAVLPEEYQEIVNVGEELAATRERVAELEAALRQADYLADLAEDVRNDEPLRAAVREYRKDRAALAGDGGGASRLHAAEQALCRAADAYVWEPKDETMEALRNARAEWQTATGLAKLAAGDGGGA